MSDLDEDYVDEAKAVLILAQQALLDNDIHKARKNVGMALRLAPVAEIKEEGETILTKIRWMETAAEKAKEASTALEKGDYPEAIRLARESITTYTTVAARELLQRAETAQHTNTPGRPDTNNYNSANRDDAEKALTIARKRLAAGKPKDAIRFAKKSLGLCRTDEAEAFLATLSDESDTNENDNNKHSEPSEPVQQSWSESLSTAESEVDMAGKATKSRTAFWENLQKHDASSPFAPKSPRPPAKPLKPKPAMPPNPAKSTDMPSKDIGLSEKGPAPEIIEPTHSSASANTPANTREAADTDTSTHNTETITHKNTPPTTPAKPNIPRKPSIAGKSGPPPVAPKPDAHLANIRQSRSFGSRPNSRPTSRPTSRPPPHRRPSAASADLPSDSGSGPTKQKIGHSESAKPDTDGRTGEKDGEANGTSDPETIPRPRPSLGDEVQTDDSAQPDSTGKPEEAEGSTPVETGESWEKPVDRGDEPKVETDRSGKSPGDRGDEPKDAAPDATWSSVVRDGPSAGEEVEESVPDTPAPTEQHAPYQAEIPDVANLEAAQLAIVKARQALAGGDREKATRLALKSNRLYKSDVAQALLNALGVTEHDDQRATASPTATDQTDTTQTQSDGDEEVENAGFKNQAQDTSSAWNSYGPTPTPQTHEADNWWEAPAVPNSGIPTRMSKPTKPTPPSPSTPSSKPPSSPATSAPSSRSASRDEFESRNKPSTPKPVRKPPPRSPRVSVGSQDAFESGKGKPSSPIPTRKPPPRSPVGSQDELETPKGQNAANKNAAEEALQLAAKAEAAGDIAKAKRMAKRSMRLFWTAEAELFDLRLQDIEVPEKPQTPATPPPKPHKPFLNVQENDAQKSQSVPSTPAASPKSSSHLLQDQVVIQRINESRTHYDVLAVLRNCSEKDIQKAYRRLARQLHPDKTKTEGAEEAFKKVSASFELLKDAEKRKLYDAALIQAQQQQMYHEQQQRQQQQQQQQQQQRRQQYNNPNYGGQYSGYQQQQNKYQRPPPTNPQFRHRPSDATSGTPSSGWSTPPPDQEFGHSAKQSPAEAQRPMYCKLGLSETIHALVADNEVHNAKAVGMVWLSLSADTVRELIERLNKGTPVAMVMELYLLGPYKFSATNPNRTVLDSVNQNFPSKLQIRLQASNLRSKLDQAAVAGGTTLPILQYDVMTKNTTEKDRRSLVPLVGSAEWRKDAVCVTLKHSDLSNTKGTALSPVQVAVVIPAECIVARCELSPAGDWQQDTQTALWSVNIIPGKPVVLWARFTTAGGELLPAPVRIRLKGRGNTMSGVQSRVDPFTTGLWVDNQSLVYETGEYMINPTVVQ